MDLGKWENKKKLGGGKLIRLAKQANVSFSI
jgi:hypothetical protein